MNAAGEGLRADHAGAAVAGGHNITANTVADYAEQARARLEPAIWHYLADGDSAANEQALRESRLMPRPLRDLRGGHTRLELFGQTLQHPLLLAPVAYQRLFHAGGEAASAMAAAAQGGQCVVSSLASQPLADIVQAAREGGGAASNSTEPSGLHAGQKGHALPDVPGPWFQLYWQGNRARSLRLLQRALHAGCSAVVFTVDAPLKRAALVLPSHVHAVNLEPAEAPGDHRSEAGDSQVFGHWMAQAPTWDDLAWLRRQTGLPLLVKGLLHPDDAEAALQAGCDGIVVSNHGGRVLEGAPTSLQALDAMAQRVAGRVPLLLDSGVRSGRDVFVALAHGATAVLLGRPAIWGLTVQGALGVAHALRLLRDELEMTMALTGCAHLKDIGPHCLHPS